MKHSKGLDDPRAGLRIADRTERKLNQPAVLQIAGSGANSARRANTAGGTNATCRADSAGCANAAGCAHATGRANSTSLLRTPPAVCGLRQAVRTPLAVARLFAATSFAAVVGADEACFAAVNFAALAPPIRDFFEIAIVFSPRTVLNSLTLYLWPSGMPNRPRRGPNLLNPLNSRGLGEMGFAEPSYSEVRELG